MACEARSCSTDETVTPSAIDTSSPTSTLQDEAQAASSDGSSNVPSVRVIALQVQLSEPPVILRSRGVEIAPLATGARLPVAGRDGRGTIAIGRVLGLEPAGQREDS